MFEKDAPVSTQLLSTAPLIVGLWTPRFIGFTTFFLGFPSGIVLASLNWMRMGLKNKAFAHLAGAAIGAFVFLLIPSGAGETIGLAANAGLSVYLYRKMQQDIDGIKASNYDVKNANWFGGCLIGLVALGLFIAAYFFLGILLPMIGVPIQQ